MHLYLVFLFGFFLHVGFIFSDSSPKTAACRCLFVSFFLSFFLTWPSFAGVQMRKYGASGNSRRWSDRTTWYVKAPSFQHLPLSTFANYLLALASSSSERVYLHQRGRYKSAHLVGKIRRFVAIGCPMFHVLGLLHSQPCTHSEKLWFVLSKCVRMHSLRAPFFSFKKLSAWRLRSSQNVQLHKRQLAEMIMVLYMFYKTWGK